GGAMRVLERLPLGRHSVLILVEIGGRRLVLAEHPHGVTLLEGCLPATESPPPPPDAPAS
ncbi:MAG: flagellar biosynthetic protein FliO, partial [Planctomycetes bacterium]|nr:flagellar biosynthetic protein FliO [Planctomycetota bacterium]